MKKVLVVYGTTEGHTRKVATFIAEHLRAQGAAVDVVDSATPAAAQVQPVYGAAVVAGSLHEHLHQRALAHFAERDAAWLNAIPSAVVSVGLAAALLYTQYDGFKRTMMRLIAKQMGKHAGDTRDHEYTDWEDLRRFVDDFARLARLADGAC